MKRVIITSNLYLPNPGGVENSLYYLALAGVNNGDEVVVIASDIITPDAPQNVLPESTFAVIRYKVLGGNIVTKFVSQLFSAFRVYRALKKKDFDVVISRHHVTSVLCWISGYRNIVYIVSGVIKYQNKSLYKQRDKWRVSAYLRYVVNQVIQVLALKLSRRVLVFSNNMMRQIEAVSPGLYVELVSPGVDPKSFLANEEKPADSVSLLILSRLYPVKNIALAIKSMEFLDDRFELIIVGDGSCYDELVALTSNLGLCARVSFAGATDNPSYYYGKAHMLLLPSLYESFGQTILEASCSGIPTVAIHSELVDTAAVSILGKLGVYAYGLDAECFSEAIRDAYSRFYSSDGEELRGRLRMGVVQKYSWDALYRNAIDVR